MSKMVRLEVAPGHVIRVKESEVEKYRAMYGVQEAARPPARNKARKRAANKAAAPVEPTNDEPGDASDAPADEVTDVADAG